MHVPFVHCSRAIGPVRCIWKSKDVYASSAYGKACVTYDLTMHDILICLNTNLVVHTGPPGPAVAAKVFPRTASAQLAISNVHYMMTRSFSRLVGELCSNFKTAQV